MVKKVGINEIDPNYKKRIDSSGEELNKVLIDNFVNLQKVLTNLSIKFEELSSNISKLLQLFEISAKSFAEKYPEGMITPGINKEFINKVDSLLDQNKTISRGITLIEERISGRPRNFPQQHPQQFPQQQFQQQQFQQQQFPQQQFQPPQSFSPYPQPPQIPLKKQEDKNKPMNYADFKQSKKSPDFD